MHVQLVTMVTFHLDNVSYNNVHAPFCYIEQHRILMMNDEIKVKLALMAVIMGRYPPDINASLCFNVIITFIKAAYVIVQYRGLWLNGGNRTSLDNMSPVN